MTEFDAFIREYVDECPTHGDYLNKIGAEHLTSLCVQPGYGYRPGLKRR